MDLHNHIMEEYETTISQHFCGVHKAIIPIARMRELVDKEDTANTIIYRCPDCKVCGVQKISEKDWHIITRISRADNIESSVNLDMANQRVLVTLPWIKDPIQPLIDKHKGNSNIHQALRVYKSQCIKGPQIKEKVRVAHSELVE